MDKKRACDDENSSHRKRPRASAEAPWEFATASRVVFGVGKAAEVGAIVGALGKNALVVTGKTTSRAQTAVVAPLASCGVASVLFSVEGEPTTEHVSAGVALGREHGVTVVVGFGGGSVIDAAKAIAILITNDGEPIDYLEVIGKGRTLSRPSLPYVAVPTTAGTGAEVTRNAVLCSTEHRVKVSLRSAYMLPAVALVDPALTLSMPPAVTASTGLDALTQCMESFVSCAANPLTDAVAREGIRRASRSLLAAYQNGADIDARVDMAYCSLFGGMALANAKLGAVHGFAGPIGGMYPTAPHGAVRAAFLADVMALNVRALTERGDGNPALEKYREIAQIVTENAAATIGDGVAWVQALCRALNVPKLASYGVRPEHVDAIVSKAAVSSSMKGNPIALTTAELTQVLQDCL